MSGAGLHFDSSKYEEYKEHYLDFFNKTENQYMEKKEGPFSDELKRAFGYRTFISQAAVIEETSEKAKELFKQAVKRNVWEINTLSCPEYQYKISKFRLDSLVDILRKENKQNQVLAFRENAIKLHAHFKPLIGSHQTKLFQGRITCKCLCK